MHEHMRSTHAQKHYCKHCDNHLKIVLKQHRVNVNVNMSVSSTCSMPIALALFAIKIKCHLVVFTCYLCFIMFLKIALNCCSIITLAVWVTYAFMIRLDLALRVSFLCCFIFTQIAFCHLQTEFVLINQRRFQHAENSIFAITAYNT